jgi:hypothetical protein
MTQSPDDEASVVRELTRRIGQLGMRSYELGSQLVDNRIDASEARTQGESLLREVDELTPEVKAIQDSDAQRRLMRDLNEVRMEALYAVERKAMSLRLNRYVQNQKK